MVHLGWAQRGDGTMDRLAIQQVDVGPGPADDRTAAGKKLHEMTAGESARAGDEDGHYFGPAGTGPGVRPYCAW